MKLRPQRGTGLLELTIVLFVLLLLAALAVPNVAQMKIDGQQQRALLSMSTLVTANYNYSLLYGGFAPNISNITNGGPGSGNQSAAGAYLASAGLVPANGVIEDGYQYTYTRTSNTAYSYTATPVLSTNHRSFYSGADGIVRFSDSGPAGAASTAMTQSRLPIAGTALMVGPPGPPGTAGAPGATASPTIGTPVQVSGNSISQPFSSGSSYWVVGSSRTVDIQPPIVGTDDGKIITLIGSPPTTGYQNNTPAPRYGLTCNSCSNLGPGSGQFFPADALGHTVDGTGNTVPAQQFVAIQGIWVPVGRTD